MSIFIDLAILPFNMFIDRIGITMFKVEYELLPKSVTQMFIQKNKDIHSHNTRNRNLLRMSTGTKDFLYHSARLWSTIVLKISIKVSLSQFQDILKKITCCIIHLYIPIQNNLNVLANNIHYPQ